MTGLCVLLVLGLLVGIQAQGLITDVFPLCDSVEAEAAALVVQDYLNAQQTHGYKYALNRIEDIKIRTQPGGAEIYLMEVELLQTYCHVLDPTPVTNCTVRPKYLTSVEADCDVALTNVSGVLSVTAFKCKSEESTEDICLGCATLLLLNDTTGLDLVTASLASFNNKTGGLFALTEIGRMTSQIVSGGPTYSAEYVIVETNCTGVKSDNCQPVSLAQRGFCQAKGLSSAHTVNCNIFAALTPIITNDTVPASPPLVHIHTGNLPANHGLRHHKLTPLYDPGTSGLLSAESAESSEVVPVIIVVPDGPLVQDALNISVSIVDPLVQDVPNIPALIAGPLIPREPVVISDDTEESGVVVVKREAPSPDAAPFAASPDNLPKLLVPRCPGKIKYF